MAILAECTWGCGPDVLLVLEKEEYGLMLYTDPVKKGRAKHGFCGNGSIDLTAAEARKLAVQLNEAADRADALDWGYEIACGRGHSLKEQKGS